MNRHDSGRGTGLALVVILIVALIAAWLVVAQMRTVRGPGDGDAQPSADLVQQARDEVDALNERIAQAAGEQP